MNKKCNYPYDDLPCQFDKCEGLVYLIIGIIVGLIFIGILI